MVGPSSRANDLRSLAVVIDCARQSTGNRFGEFMVKWLGRLVRFDHCVVFGYRGSSPPPLLFETFSPAESHIFVTLYQAGPYLLDPFHHAALERKEGFWRMRELAPDRFYTSEYYRSYYSQTKLAEEVGFFVPLADKDALVLSLMRLRATGRFGTADARLLRDMAPAVASLCRLRWPQLPAIHPETTRQRASSSTTNSSAPIFGKACRSHLAKSRWSTWCSRDTRPSPSHARCGLRPEPLRSIAAISIAS